MLEHGETMLKSGLKSSWNLVEIMTLKQFSYETFFQHRFNIIFQCRFNVIVPAGYCLL